MNSIVQLLKEIRKRPGMYIGKRSAVGLLLYLEGWMHGIGNVSDAAVMTEFQHWVADRFGIATNHSWAGIITFHSEDNVEAFEEFWKLFDEYLAARSAEEP